MKKLSLIFLLAIPIESYCQHTATTIDGRQVLLNENGTWRFMDELEKKDSPPSADTPSAITSMDCASLISIEEDKVTGRSTTAAPKDVIIASKDQKTGLAMYWLLVSGKSVILVLKAFGAGCIDDGSKVNILFRDGSRMEILHGQEFNCDGDASLKFGNLYGKKKELEMLCTKEVETIRVWGTKTFVEQDLEVDQSQTLMNSGSCIRGLMQ